MVKKEEKVLLKWQVKNYKMYYKGKIKYFNVFLFLLLLLALVYLFSKYILVKQYEISLIEILAPVIAGIILTPLILLISNLLAKNLDFYITTKAIYALPISASRKNVRLRAYHYFTIKRIKRYYVRGKYVFLVTKLSFMPEIRMRLEPNNNLNQIISALNKLGIPRARQ